MQAEQKWKYCMQLKFLTGTVWLYPVYHLPLHLLGEYYGETYEQGHRQPSVPTQDVCWSMQDPWLPSTSRAAAWWLPFCFIATATTLCLLV